MLRKTLPGTLALAGGAFFLSAAVPAQTGAVRASSADAPASAMADAVPTDSSRVAEEAGVSQVRIVRVSQARGSVQMDRNTGRGFEAAFANIPVVAGAVLRTHGGVAEVEFEDNSSLRLGPDSEIRFTRLSRSATGATETTVDVVSGLVYVSLEKGKGGDFALIDGNARVELSPGAHLRLTSPTGELAVFEGSAALRVGSATTPLSKKQTVEMDRAMNTISQVQHGVQESDFDAWDKQANSYHKVNASFAGSSGSGGGMGLYGSNDLNHYGSFVDMPGCGSMWRPYFASAGWNPFANGVWTYYPTAGYSWVSPYPWGWLPYHSGAWASCGAAGWGWRPGGSWYGLGNSTVIRIARHPQPHPMPPFPMKGAATLVPVNLKPLAISGVTKGEAFTFQRNSAGLGVPREAFGSLHSVSGNVERHGMATAPMSLGTVSALPTSARTTGLGPTTGRSSSMGGTMHGTPVASGAGMSGGMHGGSVGSGGGSASASGGHK